MCDNFIYRKATIVLLEMNIVIESVISFAPTLISSKLALPVEKMWIPYNIIDGKIYLYITFVYQVFNSYARSILICCIDMYLIIIMRQICAQLQIFKHRLELLPLLISENNKHYVENKKNELKILKDWISHHRHVYS